jgi:hypothetical protein
MEFVGHIGFRDLLSLSSNDVVADEGEKRHNYMFNVCFILHFVHKCPVIFKREQSLKEGGENPLVTPRIDYIYRLDSQ